ncbi:transcription factor ATOH8, partial [Lampetra planeri]
PLRTGSGGDIGTQDPPTVATVASAHGCAPGGDFSFAVFVAAREFAADPASFALPPAPGGDHEQDAGHRRRGSQVAGAGEEGEDAPKVEQADQVPSPGAGLPGVEHGLPAGKSPRQQRDGGARGAPAHPDGPRGAAPRVPPHAQLRGGRRRRRRRRRRCVLLVASGGDEARPSARRLLPQPVPLGSCRLGRGVRPGQGGHGERNPRPQGGRAASSSSSAFDASTGTSSGGSGDECSLSPASVGGKRRHHHHHLQLQQLQLQQQQHLHHHHLHHALSYVDERHHHLAHHHHQQYHQQQQHHQQQEQQHHQQQHHQQQQEQQQQQHTSPLPPPSKRGRFGVPVAPSEEDSMDSAGTGQGAGPRAGPGQQDDDDEDESGGAASLQGSDSKVVQQTRRLLANARERTRVHTISAAFEALRQQVPCYSYGQKLSKLAILRIACSYILALAKLANEDYSGEPGGLSFSECVEQCTRTLQAEGRAKKRKE